MALSFIRLHDKRIETIDLSFTGHWWAKKADKRKNGGQVIMRNFIMAALLVLSSINALATAIEDDIFEIEAEGSYRMEAGSSVDLAKKVALFTAKTITRKILKIGFMSVKISSGFIFLLPIHRSNSSHHLFNGWHIGKGQAAEHQDGLDL